MTTFSSEQLNFFKFSTVVLDEFPIALRQVFLYMWDNQVAPTPGFQKWDDSALVRNMFLSNEGGKTKYVPTSKSYMEWDCTALFEATLHAQSFAMPDGKGGFATLDKLYVKPRRLPKGAFHHSVFSPSGNQAEAFALSLDQLRLLRNSLFHQISTQKIDKATFDHYILLAKGAFAALGQTSKKIDDVGKLGEKDFPTARLQQLEEELRREKFKQIEDNLDKIETEVKYVGSDVQDIKRVVTDVTTKVEEVASNVKTAATDVKTKVENVASDVQTAATDVKKKVEEVGADIQTAVTDVKTKVEELGSNLQTAAVKTKVEEVGSDVQTAVTDVKTKVKQIGSDIQTVATDMRTQVKEVGSNIHSAVTDVKTKVEEVGSDVKTAVTDLKTAVEEVRTMKANVDDIKQAMQARISKGAFVPESCIPEKVPKFVGRQEECESIRNHLTDGITRVVNVWGPPGFGKTSVAINVAHHLRDMKIPVYFVPIRGMESKEELVSKLLSIFADDKPVPHISSSHWLIRCLQQVQNPFVLILDNADDLLESEDAKQHVFWFIGEIFGQCKHINLLLTTRESLDSFSHTLCVHFQKINVLDEVSSASLVRMLLSDVSEDDCDCIVKECGQVPMAIRLMCGIMKEENISMTELLEELRNSPLVEVLDNESFPDDARIKRIINTSFQRLSLRERRAFVSLAVFPTWFDIKEATAMLNEETEVSTKKIIRSLERKSLIDCADNFSHFTIHSLLRSFIEEERRNDQAVEAVFRSAQLQFYDYYIASFRAANETFLMGSSNEASVIFVDRRESILLSLSNAIKDDKLYSKVVEVLSMAELFLCALLPDEEVVFEQLYDTAVAEAKRRQIMVDERKMLAAKSFQHWGWFSSGQTWDHHLYAGFFNDDDCPAKLVCYHGVYQLLCGKDDEGISSLLSAVDRLSSCSNEVVIRLFVYVVLTRCLQGKDEEMASHFEILKDDWIEARLPWLDNLSDDQLFKEHMFFGALTLKLTSWSIKTKESNSLGPIIRAVTKIGASVYGNMLRSTNPEWELMIGVLSNMKGVLLQELIEEYIQMNDFRVDSEVMHFFSLIQESQIDILPNSPDARQHYNAKKQLRESVLNVLKDFDNVAEHDIECLFEDYENVLKSKEKVHGKDVEDLARSYDKLGCLRCSINGNRAAIESYQRAISLREEHIGDHVDTVSSLTNIGCNYFELNNAIEAERAFQRALDLSKRLGIYDTVDTANIYHSLGENQHRLCNFEKALEAYIQALKLRKKHLGEHPLTARALTEIGRVYCALHSYPDALEFCEQALAITLEVSGEHVDTAATFHLLGSIHLRESDIMSAFQAFEAAAEIRSNLLGNDKDTAHSYYWLGVVQRDMGDHKRASESFQKAADMRNILLGEHKDTANSYLWLGVVQHDMGDPIKALESFQKAADMHYNLLGDHKNTISCYNWLGKLQNDMGDHKRASESFHKAAEMQYNLIGEHEDTANGYMGLGEVQRKMGDLIGALGSLQKAADMRSNLLGEHKDTANSYFLLGVVQRDMGDPIKALESFQKATDMHYNLLGDHEETASCYHWLGVVQNDMGDHKRASESFYKAAEMRYNLLGDHEDTASCYLWLGVVQRKMGDLIGALKSFQKAADMQYNLFGEHKDTACTYHCLGEVQRDIEDYKRALEFFQKAACMRYNLLGDHSDTASSYLALGTTQIKMKDYKSASKSIHKAADMIYNLFGDHKDTASGYHFLGVLQLRIGDHKSALISLEKAVDMRSNELGDHKDTACSYFWLGKVQRDMGYFRGAAESLQKASRLKTELFGEEHSETAESFQLLNRVYEALGESE